MKLTPFDLQKAIAGAKVVTKDGRKVTLSQFYFGECEYPLCGEIEGENHSRWWTLEGVCGTGIADLCIAEPEVRWVNLHAGGGLAEHFATQAEADADADKPLRVRRLGGRAFRVVIDADGGE